MIARALSESLLRVDPPPVLLDLEQMYQLDCPSVLYESSNLTSVPVGVVSSSLILYVQTK
jgi:hypothetical protein